MKSLLLTLSLILIAITNIFSQKLIINYSTSTNKIRNAFVNTEVGIFKISNSGKLQSVIIGDSNENTFDIIDYFELRNRREKVKIAGTKIYVKNLISIDYNTDYYSNEISKDLPIEINGYKMKYYDSFYDNDLVKGKIKSIGTVKIEYYTDYYLNKKIRGKIKSIGDVVIKYSDLYTNKEILGELVQIGDIKIKYYTNEYFKDYLNFKIKSIGNYHINYFDETLNTSHNGKFKNISGIDSRFIIISDY